MTRKQFKVDYRSVFAPLRSTARRAFSLDIHPNTMSAMWSLHEARNKFSAVVEAAIAGRPQVISRRGQPAVVVGSAARYEQLLAQRSGLPDRLTKTAPLKEEAAGWMSGGSFGWDTASICQTREVITT